MSTFVGVGTGTPNQRATAKAIAFVMGQILDGSVPSAKRPKLSDFAIYEIENDKRIAVYPVATDGCVIAVVQPVVADYFQYYVFCIRMDTKRPSFIGLYVYEGLKNPPTLSVIDMPNKLIDPQKTELAKCMIVAEITREYSTLREWLEFPSKDKRFVGNGMSIELVVDMQKRIEKYAQLDRNYGF